MGGVPNSLAESKKYQGKFNAEEVKILDRIIKKHNLTVNDFIRKCVFFTVEQAEYESAILKDPEIMKMIKIMVAETKKIMSNPKVTKRIEKKVEDGKISEETVDRLENSASDIAKDMKILRKKKKSGPRRIKRKRGRTKIRE